MDRLAFQIGNDEAPNLLAHLLIWHSDRRKRGMKVGAKLKVVEADDAELFGHTNSARFCFENRASGKIVVCADNCGRPSLCIQDAPQPLTAAGDRRLGHFHEMLGPNSQAFSRKRLPRAVDALHHAVIVLVGSDRDAPE